MPKIYEEQCQLFIEQEIEDFIGNGVDEKSVAKKAQEIVAWVQDKFNRTLNKETVRRKIYVEKEKCANRTDVVTTGDYNEIENNQVGYGGAREGAGRPIKFFVDTDETRKEIVKEFKNEKKEISEERKEKLKEENEQLAEQYVEEDAIKIIHADFYEYCMDMEPNSIDLIVCDPPYPIEYHYVWNQLGEVAARVLKPSAFMFAYSGHIRINKVIEDLDKWMSFYWVCCLFHNGVTTKAMGRNMIAYWKPILMYQKEPFKKIDVAKFDLFKNDNKEKDLHEWQQGIQPFIEIIEYHSRPNDLILDPFMGSGTTLAAAKQKGRRCIGIDNDINAVNTTKTRLGEENELGR